MGKGTATPAATLLRDPRLIAVLVLPFIGVLGPNVASPALPALADAFGLSDARVGLVMTAYFLPVVVMIPVTGALADVLGRRPVVLASLAVFGTTGAAIAVVDSFAAVLALRVVQGIGFAGLTPLSVALIGDLYAGATGSTAQGLRVSALGTNDVVVPAAAGFLAAIAWHYPFLIYLLAFPAMLVVYRYLPETVDRDGDAGPSPSLAGAIRYVHAIRREVTDRDHLVLLLGAVAIFLVKTAVITFIPLYAVRVVGVGAFAAGLLLAIRGGARLVLAPSAGRVVARFNRKGAFLASMAVVAAGLLLIPAAPSFGALAGVVLFYSVGEAAFMPILNDSVAAAVERERRGGVVSVLNVMKMAANTVSPAFFGLVLAVAGFAALFWVAAGIAAAFAGVVVLAFGGDAGS